jgi:hypothetical protein
VSIVHIAKIDKFGFAACAGEVLVIGTPNWFRE